MASQEDEDPFDVLGLEMTASDQEVASAFRRKSLGCHPDRHPDDPTARARFDRLSRAKESLLDPERRKAWEYFRNHGTWPAVAGSLQSKGKGKGPAPGEWVDKGGFRARAPHERKRMEQERVQKGDEEAFQKYQAQRRAEALKHIKASTGGRLGRGDGEDIGMEEARRAFAERLEREADPKVKRQQRAEQEKSQREEERKKRDDAQRQRDQEWREREQQQAAKTRQLNEAARRHWQGWHSGPSVGPSVDSQHAAAHGQRSPMVGMWLYGKLPNKYRISEGMDGQLSFSGPDPDSDGQLCGLLVLDGEWHEVELTSSRGEPFGRMRFLYVSNDEGEEGLISQFQKAGRHEWGREIFARRDALPAAGPSEVGPPEGGTAVEEAALLSVCITIDRELGISTEVAMRRGTTVLELKERLVADDPTGGIGLEEFALGLASGGSSDEVQPLPETLELTEAHTALDLISYSSELSAAPQQPSELKAQSAEADPAASAVEELEQVPDLLAWLQAHRLDAYYKAMLENQYESLDDLCNLESGKREELIAFLEMKPGHAIRFRRALQEGIVTVGSHVAGSPVMATPGELPEPSASEQIRDSDVATGSHLPTPPLPQSSSSPPEPMAARQPEEQAPAAGIVEEPGPDMPSELQLWLRAHRLDVYHKAMLERQYASLDSLCNAPSGKHEELIALLEMKPGHAMRFRRALREGVDKTK